MLIGSFKKRLNNVVLENNDLSIKVEKEKKDRFSGREDMTRPEGHKGRRDKTIRS